MGVLLLGWAVTTGYAQPSPAPMTPSAPSGATSPAQADAGAAAPTQRVGNSGVSRLALVVTQVGALRCVERADQVAKFFGRGTGDTFIVHGPVAGGAPDLMAVTMIVQQGGNNPATIDIHLSPTPNGCAASYAASVTSNEPCPQAERKLYSALSFKAIDALPHRMAAIGNEARVLSRPIPGGCLLTKYEVIR